jgi:hypothetical protein
MLLTPSTTDETETPVKPVTVHLEIDIHTPTAAPFQDDGCLLSLNRLFLQDPVFAFSAQEREGSHRT